MTPLQIRKLRLNRVSAEDTRWFFNTLNRISELFGVGIGLMPDGTLTLIS